MEKFIEQNKIKVPGRFNWRDKDRETKVLFCNTCCKVASLDPCLFRTFSNNPTALCCKRLGFPFWLFSRYKHMICYLDIEYTTETGQTNIIKDDTNKSFHILEHNNGNMSRFPGNICDYPKLVNITIVGNKIEDLINLRCLKFLDTLELEGNRLSVLKASSLYGISSLRYLSLSDNQITYIEHRALNIRPGLSLAELYLGWNRLITIDISNLLLGYYFDHLEYCENHISTITNDLEWSGFADEDCLGGGEINLRRNKFTRMPSLLELGFKNMKLALPMTFNYVMHLEHNPWICDCTAYKYVTLTMDMLQNFDELQFRCANPPNLKGYTVRHFYGRKDLEDRLICDITLKEKCPPKCKCFKQPSRKRVVVTCSYIGYRKMPTALPDYDDLDIDLSHNMIQMFVNRYYLTKTKRIDLFYNRIVVVDKAVYSIDKLDVISLRHNKITSLERSLLTKNPCKFSFGNLKLSKCKCGMMWIKIWLDRPKERNCVKFHDIITCKKGKENIDIIALSENELCPPKWSYGIYVWLLVPVLWVTKEFYVYLNNLEYNMCIPCKDIPAGGAWFDQISEHISKSKCFIVILSEKYLKSEDQITEWNKIWNTFKSDETTNIIVVNFDLLKSRTVEDRRLKAFVRLGYGIPFSNLNKTLLKDIAEKLGPPTDDDS